MGTFEGGWWGWGASVGIACTYVGSLYVWPNAGGKKPARRDDPGVIKRRFVSLGGTCLVAWVPLWRALRASPLLAMASAMDGGVGPPTPTFTFLLRALGVELWPPAGAVTSTVATLGLTAALFLGPLTCLALDGELIPRFARAARGVRDSIHTLRNVVVAPITEEFAFRSCVTPTLLYSGAASLRTAVLVCPLFFGVAHAHHFVELRRSMGSTRRALLAVALQFTYTTAFGWYAAFALMRTGHVAGPIASHAFCNVMGLPDVARAWAHPRRGLVLAAYLAGVAVFACGLCPATDPAWHPSSSWNALAAVSRELHARG